MSVIIWSYSFSTNTAEPPTGNQARLNAGHPYTTATTLWLQNLNADGVDVHAWLMLVPVGAALYLQDKNDHTLGVHVTTTALPIDKTSYVEFAVAWVANAGALLNQAIELAVVTDAVIPPIPVPEPDDAVLDFYHVTATGLLITLAEAKTHLHITTAAHDADITAKLEQAQDIILDFLKHGADPAWTADTLPLPVRSAVLLVLTHLYDHRGEDMEPDEALWTAIGRLLVRFRDPALA